MSSFEIPDTTTAATFRRSYYQSALAALLKLERRSFTKLRFPPFRTVPQRLETVRFFGRRLRFSTTLPTRVFVSGYGFSNFERNVRRRALFRQTRLGHFSQPQAPGFGDC